MKEKNKYGQYFTIAPVAEFMVKLISHNEDCKILEPSCGKGIFLSKLYEKGFKNIDAYEIDETLDNPFHCVKYESFISAPLNNYDVVIGNPPYIRWKNLEKQLKDELASSPLWNHYFNSLCDYLFIFILKSIEQLNEEGELIFICTDYWMNTTHSSTLRNYMVRNGYFSEIYHFKEAPLFENVCASFMIFRYVKTKKSSAPKIKLFKYINEKKIKGIEDLLDGNSFILSEIPQFKENERWLLVPEKQQEILCKIEDSCRRRIPILFENADINRIGDVCDIGNGMVSGLDKAFNISDLVFLNKEEKASTIKVLKAKDLRPYMHVSESAYFFIDKRISEEEFIRFYPNVFQYMIRYKDNLLKRYNYGKDIPYWEFVFPRNLNLFMRKEKRILVPCKERISNKNYFRFSLASENYMPLQDVTGIFKKRTCKESIEYITAYLNNWRVFDWLKYNGIIKGHIVEFSESPIASIPYRPIDWENDNERMIHDEITKDVIKYAENKDENCIEKIDNCFNILFS
ncbi:MAG: N-6 DNA methylase [Bacteroidetes bacterium]|uniref:site-specific DNA-methyltransferase (adenine-specific) n=1 Tax=Candidatus Merdivivens pullistercoris TaxID=2840873 RepID=A0A9D9I4V7_9BACT|nr:N-6 DNA methylase [Candidatus Merdivivens pullistercoris]